MINAGDRLVTLETEEGEPSTIKVAEDARLDMVDIGDQVRQRVTPPLLISLTLISLTFLATDDSVRLLIDGFSGTNGYDLN